MPEYTASDHRHMQHALALAHRAEEMGEVPVGAVLTINNAPFAEGFNRPIANHDPCAHAEIVALRHAAKRLQNYRITDATLYVTLEPCAMCAGAIIHARIKRLVYAAADPKTGAAGSVFNLFSAPWINHLVTVERGLLAQESRSCLQAFFKARRQSRTR